MLESASADGSLGQRRARRQVSKSHGASHCNARTSLRSQIPVYLGPSQGSLSAERARYAVDPDPLLINEELGATMQLLEEPILLGVVMRLAHARDSLHELELIGGWSARPLKVRLRRLPDGSWPLRCLPRG